MYIMPSGSTGLTRLRRRWRRGELRGIFLIYGPSGSGKTTFLNSIFDENTPVFRCTGRSLAEAIICSILSKEPIEQPTERIVFAEHMDDLLAHPSTREAAFQMLDSWKETEKGDDRLIILTAETGQVASYYELSQCVELHPLKINRRIVRLAAAQRRLRLSLREKGELAKCSAMTKLNEKLNRIELMRTMKHQ